ncbi:MULTISPECIES: LexA family protein [Pantoea]|uniref:LexA family protein n=1 Tax=Pantoea TaxID=53335 RepID=UPI001D6048BF|nr:MULTISPECIES: LexA family transcriptional regulator [Pantoea]MBZ6387399.1 XRE family transcriptional regulator [Pantoea piersonii]MBZ6400710.1 XRE family transcriptional regulator [Pantoea piersonii]MBZ6408678.1 XRE family transcriptional regulator [Pantoea piersonii]
MNFDSKFNERVSSLRKSLGMTQTALAKQVGIVQRQIAAYEAGESKPRDAVLVRLASALGTTAGWLASGDGQEPNLKNFIPYTSVRQIPLVTMGPYADRIEEVLKCANTFHPCNIEVSDSAFAMRIMGESMVGSDGYSFPEGCIIVFDPKVEVQQGSFVLFGYEDEMTFKQYFSDLFQVTLKALNKNYGDLVLNKGDGEVIATAVYAEMSLLRSPILAQNIYQQILMKADYPPLDQHKDKKSS